MSIYQISLLSDIIMPILQDILDLLCITIVYNQTLMASLDLEASEADVKQ